VSHDLRSPVNTMMATTSLLSDFIRKDRAEVRHWFEVLCQSIGQMKGLIEEGSEILDEDGDESVLDAGIIVAAQKVEHYEMATYGSLRTFAQLLDQNDAAAAKRVGRDLVSAYVQRRIARFNNRPPARCTIHQHYGRPRSRCRSDGCGNIDALPLQRA